MTDRTMTLDDLRRILLEEAGAGEGADLDGDILDTDFGDLGYDSIALLETASRLNRDYEVEIDTAVEARTPRQLLDVVNAA
ncbi:acyl carrier protein [Actinomadura roseirufa]|uniref:acyl carrier protein n=1 Tax=Actinomadura roseirufa TaxID=2094049 RepID=UPI00104116F5|nr:acyl carrier protein [Actinomadura roseirufa]